MATQQTSPGFGRSVEANRGGFPRLALKLDALAACLAVGAAHFEVMAAWTGYPSAFATAS